MLEQIGGPSTHGFVIDCAGTVGQKIELNHENLKDVIENIVGKENLNVKVGYQTHLDFSETFDTKSMNEDLSPNDFSKLQYPERNNYSVEDLVEEIN